MAVRVFYHQPTPEGHEDGPVHFQDSEDRVHILPVTKCGLDIPREWHRHTIDGLLEYPPYLEVICKFCVAHDLLRCIGDNINRSIAVDCMLLNYLPELIPGYKTVGITTGRFSSSEPSIQNLSSYHKGRKADEPA
jgi:hypothetical protein